MQKRLFVFGLLLAVLALAIPATAQDEVTFTFGEFGNPEALYNMNTTEGISFRVLTQGCEALLRFEGVDVVPHLATSWTTSEDGLTWVFQLRDDVMFHDGTPFNAEAVAWNFNSWGYTDHPGHYEDFIYTYYNYFYGGWDEDSVIEAVEATGEFEVTFTLRNPDGTFLGNMAPTMTAIHSPTALQEAGTSYGQPDVGFVCTGPYVFSEWISDQHVILERNQDYWGENPSNIDKIVYRVIPDNAARLAALQSGEIDAFEQPNVEDLEGIEASDDLYLLYRPPSTILYLGMNYRVQELLDVRVRQAISLAIDRQAIVDAFYPPGTLVAKTQVPPSLMGFNPDIPDPVYDPEAARALLAEAGYPDGFSEMTILGYDEENQVVTDEVIDVQPLKLWFQPVTRPYNPDGEGIGEAMASYLADIGIEVTLETRDWGDYLQMGRDGELFGLWQLGWSPDVWDPDNYTGTFFGGTEIARKLSGNYQNPELAAIIAEAKSLADPADRAPLYQQADQILYDDTVRLFIAHSVVPLAFRSCVSGYVVHPLNEYFKSVTMDCD